MHIYVGNIKRRPLATLKLTEIALIHPSMSIRLKNLNRRKPRTSVTQDAELTNSTANLHINYFADTQLEFP